MALTRNLMPSLLKPSIMKGIFKRIVSTPRGSPDSWLMIIETPTTPPSKIVNGTRNSSKAKAAITAPTVIMNSGPTHCLKMLLFLLGLCIN